MKNWARIILATLVSFPISLTYCVPAKSGGIQESGERKLTTSGPVADSGNTTNQAPTGGVATAANVRDMEGRLALLINETNKNVTATGRFVIQSTGFGPWGVAFIVLISGTIARIDDILRGFGGRLKG